METTDLYRTALHEFHISHAANMVPFAGYAMPVHYAKGVKQEHLHTREHAGLFDISHMGQLKLSGENAIALLEALTPSSYHDLSVGKQRYSVLINEQGGIIDDIMVTNAGDYFFIVINAAHKHDVIEHIRKHLPENCTLESLEDSALIALQGPDAADVLQRFCPEATRLKFMSGKQLKLNGHDCFINRCGYTGEDGFEISIRSDQIEAIVSQLLTEAEVELIGLGARDSLRLEAGYCLYGHDIDAETSPIEARLSWLVSKPRLQNDKSVYPGLDRLRQELEHGTSRLRVGIISEEKAPIREGVNILNTDNETVGITSSGGYSPCLGKPIAMAYVQTAYADVDTNLIAKIRNRTQHVKVCKLPFIKHRYYQP